MGKSSSWYARASQMGLLMSKGKSKGELFGAVADKVIRNAVLYNKHGIEEDISSKYTKKGIINEPIALKMIMKSKGWKDMDLNKTRLFNDYVTGEPDLWDKGILADVKCSFNAHTFFEKVPLKELKDKNYIMQMQCYMWLCDVDVSYLAYCLTDHPQSLVMKEIQHKTYDELDMPHNYDKDMSEVEELVSERIEKQSQFSHIPEEKRIKIFTVRRDESQIETIKQRVIEARERYDHFYNLI